MLFGPILVVAARTCEADPTHAGCQEFLHPFNDPVIWMYIVFQIVMVVCVAIYCWRRR